MRSVSRFLPWGADAGLVLLTLCPPLLMQPAADPSGRAWALLAGFEVLAAAALFVRQKVPAGAFLVIITAMAIALVWGAGQGVKLSPLVVLPLAVSLYALGGSGTSWARTGAAVLGGVLVVGVGVLVNRSMDLPSTLTGGPDVLAVLAPMPLIWATGFAARTHRENLAASARRMAELVREQEFREQQAAQQERVRIAREMHDVVAHSLTLLVVRAETMRARGGELPDWVRTEITGLAVAGRQASGELRDLLRVLRGPEDEAPLQPLPGLGDLPELLERSRAAGMRVDARLEVDPDDPPRPVQLTCYRLVQEALTNARRHAPGAVVTVNLTMDEDGWVRCEVANGRPTGPATPGLGTGLGLVSMRERVDALSGRLVTGPWAEGGFRVLAELPISARDRADV